MVLIVLIVLVASVVLEHGSSGSKASNDFSGSGGFI